MKHVRGFGRGWFIAVLIIVAVVAACIVVGVSMGVALDYLQHRNDVRMIYPVSGPHPIYGTESLKGVL